MRNAPFCLTLTAALLAVGEGSVAAQGITVTPAVGAFVPSGDLRDLRDQAEQRRAERASTFGLGFNVEAGWIRGSLAYATGATLTERGVSGDIGDGSVLAVAADVVWRPIPRFIVQPYLLGGGGVKRQDYSYDVDGLESIFPSEKTDFTLHFGAGADLMLGGIGIMAEITDYLSRRSDDSFGQHDAFFLVGLKFRLGGG